MSVRSIQYTEEYVRDFDLLLAAIAQMVLWQTIIRKTEDDVGACSGDDGPSDAARRATVAVAFMDGLGRRFLRGDADAGASRMQTASTSPFHVPKKEMSSMPLPKSVNDVAQHVIRSDASELLLPPGASSRGTERLHQYYFKGNWSNGGLECGVKYVFW